MGWSKSKLTLKPKSLSKLVAVTVTAFTAGAAHADFTGNLGPISAPASIAFSDSTGTNLTVRAADQPVLPVPYNFLDTWTFDLSGNASVTTLTAAFKFDDGAGGLATFGINDIQVNLFDASNSVVAVGWQTVSNNFPFSNVVSITPATGLAAGPYRLQVRGALIAAPGAYSGTLIAAAPSAVPLPAALPLLVVGLGGFGVFGARRKPASSSAS